MRISISFRYVCTTTRSNVTLTLSAERRKLLHASKDRCMKVGSRSCFGISRLNSTYARVNIAPLQTKMPSAQMYSGSSSALLVFRASFNLPIRPFVILWEESLFAIVKYSYPTIYQSLNPLNEFFFISCFIPPTTYDSTSVSCGATCNPLDEIQCCVQGNGLFLMVDHIWIKTKCFHSL